MGSTSVTTTTYHCDLCGEVKDQGELRHLLSEGEYVPGSPAGRHRQLDVCGECAQTRSIADALAYLAEPAGSRNG